MTIFCELVTKLFGELAGFAVRESETTQLRAVGPGRAGSGRVGPGRAVHSGGDGVGASVWNVKPSQAIRAPPPPLPPAALYTSVHSFCMGPDADSSASSHCRVATPHCRARAIAYYTANQLAFRPHLKKFD